MVTALHFIKILYSAVGSRFDYEILLLRVSSFDLLPLRWTIINRGNLSIEEERPWDPLLRATRMQRRRNRIEELLPRMPQRQKFDILRGTLYLPCLDTDDLISIARWKLT